MRLYFQECSLINKYVIQSACEGLLAYGFVNPPKKEQIENIVCVCVCVCVMGRRGKGVGAEVSSSFLSLKTRIRE